MNFNEFLDKCRSLGQEQPTLNEDELRRQLAKIIVRGKLLDEDAFEAGEKAYKEAIS
jgi:hypothetical protein